MRKAEGNLQGILEKQRRKVMVFEGTENIMASREEVWGFLTNPDMVSQCVPGLRSVDILVPDRKFRAIAAIGFGAVQTTFDNEIEFVELKDHEYAKIQVHGKAPGSGVDAIAEMKLSDGEEGTTTLDWSADITIVGTIASLANRMMGGVTRKLTAIFFKCVKGKIETE
jgi:carbon monoxide dehydrogenase subunit G